MTFRQRIVRWDEARILTEIDIRTVKLRRPELSQRDPKAKRLHCEKVALADRLVELRTPTLPSIPEPEPPPQVHYDNRGRAV